MNKRVAYYQICNKDIDYGYSMYLYPILNKILINMPDDELDYVFIKYNVRTYRTFFNDIEMDYHIMF
jgi:hypothetical protein